MRAGKLSETVIQLGATDVSEAFSGGKPMWIAILKGGNCIAGGIRGKFATKHMDLTELLFSYDIDLDKYEGSDTFISEFIEDF